MKLRGRFTVWFALAAVVPIAAAALATREVLSATYRERYERRRDYAETLLRRDRSELEQSVARRVASLASRDDPYVGGALLDLDTYGGQLPATSRRRIKEQGRRLMDALELELLFLVGPDDRVLDAPHYRPAEGELDETPRQRAAALSGKPYYTEAPVLEDGAIRRILVVESARTVRDGPHQVHVVGGRRVTAALIDAARGEAFVDARIVDAAGEVLVPPTDPWPDRPPTARLPLSGPGGEPVAWVEMQVEDDEQAIIAEITFLTTALGIAALVGTIALGFFAARRMSRDLDELVVGAEAAARGDLHHQVPVRTRDEIGAVAEAFNAMMTELEESKARLVMAERIAAWQEIARRLAHEIKNPLTPIQMSMETLRKTWDKKHPSFDEIFEESTQTVLEEAARLKRIVGEFSEFARMPKPEMRPLDLNELVSSQLSLYAGSVDIRIELDPDLPAIDGDRDALSQAILNLVENARDAVGPDAGAGAIAVTTRATREGRAVSLSVEDAGPGVAPENKGRLFTPYFTTKHAVGGTGLGLAIVHRIVSDHGGKIVCADSDLGGARFAIELPAQGASAEDLLTGTSMRMPRARR